MSGRRRRERAFAPMPPEPLDRERAMAKFRHLAGRSVTLGFMAYGPLVEAATPAQLAEKVEAALVERARMQRPS